MNALNNLWQTSVQNHVPQTALVFSTKQVLALSICKWLGVSMKVAMLISMFI